MEENAYYECSFVEHDEKLKIYKHQRKEYTKNKKNDNTSQCEITHCELQAERENVGT